MVSPGKKLVRNKIIVGLNIYKIMNDFEHHNSSKLVAPVLQSVPPKSV